MNKDIERITWENTIEDGYREEGKHWWSTAVAVVGMIAFCGVVVYVVSLMERVV